MKSYPARWASLNTSTTKTEATIKSCRVRANSSIQKRMSTQDSSWANRHENNKMKRSVSSGNTSMRTNPETCTTSGQSFGCNLKVNLTKSFSMTLAIIPSMVCTASIARLIFWRSYVSTSSLETNKTSRDWTQAVYSALSTVTTSSQCSSSTPKHFRELLSSLTKNQNLPLEKVRNFRYLYKRFITYWWSTKSTTGPEESCSLRHQQKKNPKPIKKQEAGSINFVIFASTRLSRTKKWLTRKLEPLWWTTP